MPMQTLCVLGGGGFIGHHLVSLLAARGYRVRVPARRREDAKALLVLPGVEVIETDIHDETCLRELLGGVDAAVNLVGILHETARGDADTPKARRGSFRQAHVELPRKVVAACRECGVPRLLHMSALGADPTSASAYQRSKAEGEAVVLGAAQAGLAVTVFRPSVVFGPGDSFLALFADLLKLAPVVPLAGAHARFQPVYVGDVARAFADALERPETFGQAYNLCGPRVYSLAELVRLTAQTLGMTRLVLPLGDGASYLFARVMELKPGAKIMTRDNYHAMRTDNVCPQGFPALFGAPTPLESVIGYLREDDPRRQYCAFRARAGR
ncbi:MAG: complex I NDUFA9 subunit family protein [Betaproteobacteria bacterium]|nr:complex I NDUFA9 subunit family protein [Betaproteobacteria bacterium]